MQSLAASAGVVGFLTAFAAAEHALAELAGSTLSRALPGPQQWWRLTGHAAFLGALAIGGGTLFDHIVRGLEAGATNFEPVLGASAPPSGSGPRSAEEPTAASHGPPWAGRAAGMPPPMSGRHRCHRGPKTLLTCPSTP